MIDNPYETQRLLAEYLLFHYGTPEEILPPHQHWPAGMESALGFPARTAARFSSGRVNRALDVGCAVGRSTFEMARRCDHVLGVDFSQSFIHVADTLKDGGEIPYARLEEAMLTTPLVARAPAFPGAGEVTFATGDAMDLPAELGQFDRVHAANLICRLPEPLRFLRRLPDLVKSGGELVLATPCTWLAEFTPPDQWPQADTFTWLKKILVADFELRAQEEEPFLIRETARKFQWTSAMLTVWTRK
ncbi:MAG: methyltransferase domain-containing protein [Luteolibacter sp.]